MQKKERKEKIDWRIIVAVVICLTIAEIVAMLKGLNGALFALYATILGGLAGWIGLPQLKLK